MIDLRSDTVTQPSHKMLEFMMKAKVGDDVLGDDPTVIQLEKKAADMFGHEAALLCPSGTMTNQIAIKVHTNAPGEVICSDLAHIYRYEGGGIAFNSGLSIRLIEGDQGRFTLEQLQAEINPNDVHFPESQLVALENTCNKGGGCYWDIHEIKRIKAFCSEQSIPMHLDGARIFNALVASGSNTKEMGELFDSISICLSKGLGAPVGSLLLGNSNFIKKARRIRKILGGGMRQAGYLAAAGIYALDHHLDRLEIDHEHARKIAATLEGKSWIKSISAVDTNILIYELNDDVDMADHLTHLEERQVRAISMGPQTIRMVTHLNVSQEDVNTVCEVLNKM